MAEQTINAGTTPTKRLGDLNILPDGVLKGGVLHYFDEDTQSDHKLELVRLLQSAVLGAIDGYKHVGVCPDVATLRTVEPDTAGQHIEIAGYTAGSLYGGGRFRFMDGDTTSVDDGGVVIVTPGGARWKRVKPANDLTVADFGAAMDGVTDDMPAVKRMLAYSRSVSNATALGIKFPPGKIALGGTLDLSTATEQAAIRIEGPHVMFGVLPVTEIYYLDKSATTPVFQFNARRMEISGVFIRGEGDSTTPFLKNVCERGEYVRGTNIRVEQVGGTVFDVVDTIDTKFDQVYMYNSTAEFLLTRWSNGNPGVWDHPTAIEISNANFSANKTTEVIKAIRAGQSIMRNVWFSNNEYTFDVSQGGWLFDTVIMENSTHPAKTQYAKILCVGCRFAQGSTLDDSLSGYDPSMDNGAPIPTWVTNKMDQGFIDLNLNGSHFETGLASQFSYSTTVLENTTGAEKWVNVGTMVLNDRGRVAHLRFVGCQGWDSAGSALNRPGGTNFAGGEAHVYIESKIPNVENTSTVEVHWHGENSSPIQDVKFVHSWGMVTVYVQLRLYALFTALYVETNGKSRATTGTPFYMRLVNNTVDDITAVPNIAQASNRWAINGGKFDGNGFGMDLDAGKLVLYSTARQVDKGATVVPIIVNGIEMYMQINPYSNLPREYVYYFADLPTPNRGQWSTVLCRDTAKTVPCQLVYSDGTKWRYVNDPDTELAAAAATPSARMMSSGDDTPEATDTEWQPDSDDTGEQSAPLDTQESADEPVPQQPTLE